MAVSAQPSDEYSDDDYSSISNYESVMMRIAANSYSNKELLEKFMGMRPTRGHVSLNKSYSMKRSASMKSKRREYHADDSSIPDCVNVNYSDEEDIASEVSVRSDWMVSQSRFRIDNREQHIDNCLGLRPPRPSSSRRVHKHHVDATSTKCTLSSLACVVGDKKGAIVGDTFHESSSAGYKDDKSGTTWF